MDPDANLEQQLSLADTIIADATAFGTVDVEYAHRLAHLIFALDKWLVYGGTLPNRWRKQP